MRLGIIIEVTRGYGGVFIYKRTAATWSRCFAVYNGKYMYLSLDRNRKLEISTAPTEPKSQEQAY